MFCIIFSKKINTKPLKVFFIYTISQVVFSFLIYTSVYVYNSYQGYLLVLRLHLLVEFSFLSAFFYFLFKNNFFKNIILFFSLPFYIYNIYEYQKNGNASFNNYPTILEFLIFIIYAIFFLFELISSNIFEPVSNNVIFWINVGLFVYFCGNFFYILLVQNSINADTSVQTKLMIIYSVVSILKNILIGLAFLSKDNKSPNNKSESFPKDLNLDMF